MVGFCPVYNPNESGIRSQRFKTICLVIAMSMKVGDKSRQRRQQCKLAQKECKVGAVYKAQPTLFFLFLHTMKSEQTRLSLKEQEIFQEYLIRLCTIIVMSIDR